VSFHYGNGTASLAELVEELAKGNGKRKEERLETLNELVEKFDNFKPLRERK